MLTYEKARVLYNEAMLRWQEVNPNAADLGYSFSNRHGCKIRKNIYLSLHKNGFVVTFNFTPLFFINPDDEYTLCVIESKSKIRNIINKLTPCRMRIVKNIPMIGRVPYYRGLKLDKEGEVLIPKIWGKTLIRRRHYRCGYCDKYYTNKMCTDCLNLEDS